MEIIVALNTDGKPMYTTDGKPAYQYTDPEQTQLVFDILNLTGWDMTGFDIWINTPAYWKKHPKKLDHLLCDV